MFDTLALQYNGSALGGACRCLQQGEVYLISRTCIYKGVPEGDETGLAAGRPCPYDKEVSFLDVHDLNRARPEVLFMPVGAAVDKALLEPGMILLPVLNTQAGAPGVWLLKDEGEAYRYTGAYAETGMEVFKDVPMRACKVPEAVGQTLAEHGFGLEQFKPCLTATTLGGMPTLVLVGDTGLLYLTLSVSKARDTMKPVILPDGTTLVGDAWNDKQSVYKKLIKKRSMKMKGLGNPITGKKTEPAPSAAALVAKANPKEPEVAAAVAVDMSDAVSELLEQQPAESQALQATDAADTAPVPAATPEEPEVQSAPVPAVQAAEQSVVPELDPEPARRTARQRKPARPVGLDLDKVIEELNADVEPITTPEQMDKANADVKKCRDLGIVLLRRIANTMEAMSKSSRAAVETLSGIRGLMK